MAAFALVRRMIKLTRRTESLLKRACQDRHVKDGNAVAFGNVLPADDKDTRKPLEWACGSRERTGVTIEPYIAEYGYLALLLGVLVEGELVVITAGFLAYRQILNLDWVIGTAVLGSLLTYQFFFWLGRTQGTRVLQARPRWQARLAKTHELLERHHAWVTLGYRGLFGLRMITPFALGMTRVSHRRFFALDLLPALVWALTFSYLGYFLGRELDALALVIERYQGWAAPAIIGTAVGAVAAVLALRRARAARSLRPDGSAEP